MSFILLLLTLAVFIVLELVKSSKKRALTQRRAAPEAQVTYTIVERYYHPGHAWMVVNSPEVVTVGVDDFAQRVLGHLSGVQMPLLGTSVRQGEVYATIERGGKFLPQIAPLSGIVVDVNNKLVGRPQLVNTSPFDRGWIAKIAPANLSLEIRNLLHGAVAERWEEAVRSQLIQWFSPPLHSVLQDGGRIAENVSDLMNEQEWERFVQEFFPNAGMIRNNDIKN